MKNGIIGFGFVLLICLLSASTVHATSYTLTLIAQGSGNIGENPTNSTSTFPQGATITVTAIPATGWYFSNWSGDTNGSVNPLNVTMESALVFTGNFLPYPTYTLTLVTNGQGTIGLNPTGGSYYSNTVVTATATPAAGWVFTGWSNATNTTTNPVTLALDASASLTGTFAELPKIDTEPLNVTNVSGSTVSFTSLAEGAAPLGYQWYFSGGSLGIATNPALSLTNVSTGQQGNYWLIVTNNYGSATSYVASLTLTNPAGPPTVVTTPTEAGLLTAFQTGGWIGLNFNGTVALTNTITITNNVILDGNGVAVTLSGGNAVRLFTVAPGASLTLSNLTLANGYCVVSNGTLQSPSADGGAIYNSGTLIVDNCTLTNNSAYSSLDGGLARGGAIFNNGGFVLLDQSCISSNSAIGGGPNSYTPNPTTSTSLGGAIYNMNGSLIIIGCNVSSNLSESVCEAPLTLGGPNGLSMGGAIYQVAGLLTIANSVFNSNLSLGGNDPEIDSGVPSPAYGGAIATGSGNLSISYSQFFDNQAIGGGGGPHEYAAPAFGGAVYCASTWNAADSAFTGNQAVGGRGAYNFSDPAYTAPNNGMGGGIYNAGTLTLNRCFICSNSAAGGLVYAGGGTYSVGAYGQGGGIFNSSQLNATNCTIALNFAIGGNGSPSVPPGLDGCGGSAWGGGLFNNTNAIFIGMNLTIATNSCYSPATVSGPYITTNGFTGGAQIANTNGTLALHNSIIAYSGTNSDAYGAITDNGFNFSDDGSVNFSSGSSFNFTDPQLAPLGNNGGPTLTMALLSTSPAIDWGDTSDFPNVDQRGYVRPNGAGPDAGAYEYGSTPAFNRAMTMLPVHGNLVLSFTVVPSHAYHFQVSGDLSSWSDLNVSGPYANATNICEVVTEQPSGQHYFRLMIQ